jgi:hypothetical protein
MLGRREAEWPRFRDCFLSEDDKYIDVFLRVGGANRNCGFGEEELYEDENFVETFDWEDDNTYAIYRFSVPEKWKADFDCIVDERPYDVSDEYKEVVKKFYPLLDASGIINDLFKKEKEENESCT